MRVLFYGDSNTYGFDPRDPFDDRYPAEVRWTDRLAVMLNEPAKEPAKELAREPVKEETKEPAKDGAAIAEGGSTQSTAERGRWEVIARGQNGRCVPVMPQMAGYIRNMIREVWPVDRFAVMLGTNDLLQTHRPDAALPAAQMRQLLLFLRKEFPEMERMLIAPLILFETLPNGAYFKRCREQSCRLAQFYEKIASETGSMYVDAGKWKIDLAEDAVHFSEKGHAQFAEEIVKYF